MSSNKKIVLIGIPIHGNIGDAAIVLAEKKFIQDNFPQYELQTILDNNIEKDIENIKKEISDNDIILLHGGGNLGDEYILCENRRRLIIESFPNNKIILMPQSIYFNNTEYAKKELEISKKIYNNHKNLTLIARELVSFEIMKKEFNNTNVILTPDIVMYLNKTEKRSRNGVLFAMRKDVEKVLTNEQIECMNKQVSKYFNKQTLTDTHLGHVPINCDSREKVVEDKLEEFRNAELVITDRLHGMIFALITSTPCIALGNYNHKIESSFEWLKNQGYIKFINNPDNIEHTILDLKNNENIKYNNTFALKEYNQIIDLINS